MIYSHIDELIGNTPMMELNNIEKSLGLKAHLLAKLEFLNPAGSVKDRIAKAMIDDAEQKGLINADTLIIEPTSGNTGIGLSAVAAARGYHAVIVMPSSMSEERRTLMKAYGAELVLSDGALGMKGAIEKAEEIHRENPNSIIAGQFVNPANPQAHYLTTGPEIWNDTNGKIDAFVAGVGSGGTISGTGKYLKEQNSKIKVVAVEPTNSAVLSGGKAGPHGLQGIGAGFITEVTDTSLFDRVITITDEEAYEYGRMIGKKEGFLVGITSGAALAAAVKLAKEPEYQGKNIVILLPDTGDRYLSTQLFKE